MSLFQKKPDTNTSIPLYSLGLNKTLLIAGLGNIGREYEDTRHNIGFRCMEELAAKLEFDPWMEKKDHKCLFTSKNINGTKVILIKPTTLMNNSGQAVQAVSHFYKVPVDNIVAVHDELDIPFGQIRTRMGGSDAGNNGVKSIIHHCGDNFGRVRIGIKTETPMNATDFVLAKFSPEESEHLPALMKEATAILSELAYGGNVNHDTRSFII